MGGTSDHLAMENPVMAFIPSIRFSGICRAAIAFYCEVFNGTDLVFMTYRDMPSDAGGLPSDLILYTQFTTPSGQRIASDMPPACPRANSRPSGIMIGPPTVAEGQRLFDTLSNGGAVVVPFGPTA